MVHDTRMDDPVFEPEVKIILTEPIDQEIDRDDVPKDKDGNPIVVEPIRPLSEKLKDHYKNGLKKKGKERKFGTQLAPPSVDK